MRSLRDERTARERGSVTPVEGLVLAVMTAILIAIAVPSYIAMRDRANDSAARGNVRRAVDAVEAYQAERGSYAGAVPAVLIRYGDGLGTSGYRVRVTRDRYCVESSVGGRTWHMAGPAGTVSPGSCR